MTTDWIIKAKKIMKERGITQRDLLPVMGKSTRGAIGHYFTGRSQPSIKQFQSLASFLDMSLGELCGGEERPALKKNLLEQCMQIVWEVATEQKITLSPAQSAKIVTYLYQLSIDASEISEEVSISKQAVFDLVDFYN